MAHPKIDRNFEIYKRWREKRENPYKLCIEFGISYRRLYYIEKWVKQQRSQEKENS